MKICLINGGFDTELSTVDTLLQRCWHVPKLADALAALGNQVTAVQAFHHSASVPLEKATLELVETKVRRGDVFAELRDTDAALEVVQAQQPEIVHVFGLVMPRLMSAVAA